MNDLEKLETLLKRIYEEKHNQSSGQGEYLKNKIIEPQNLRFRLSLYMPAALAFLVILISTIMLATGGEVKYRRLEKALESASTGGAYNTPKELMETPKPRILQFAQTELATKQAQLIIAPTVLVRASGISEFELNIDGDNVREYGLSIWISGVLDGVEVGPAEKIGGGVWLVHSATKYWIRVTGDPEAVQSSIISVWLLDRSGNLWDRKDVTLIGERAAAPPLMGRAEGSEKLETTNDGDTNTKTIKNVRQRNTTTSPQKRQKDTRPQPDFGGAKNRARASATSQSDAKSKTINKRDSGFIPDSGVIDPSRKIAIRPCWPGDTRDAKGGCSPK